MVSTSFGAGVPSGVASHYLAAARILREGNLLCTTARRIAVSLAEAFGLMLLPMPDAIALGPQPTSLVFHNRYAQHPAHRWLRGLSLRPRAGLSRAPRRSTTRRVLHEASVPRPSPMTYPDLVLGPQRLAGMQHRLDHPLQHRLACDQLTDPCREPTLAGLAELEPEPAHDAPDAELDVHELALQKLASDQQRPDLLCWGRLAQPSAMAAVGAALVHQGWPGTCRKDDLRLGLAVQVQIDSVRQCRSGADHDDRG
jgi:hypothetical protein